MKKTFIFLMAATWMVCATRSKVWASTVNVSPAFTNYSDDFTAYLSENVTYPAGLKSYPGAYVIVEYDGSLIDGKAVFTNVRITKDERGVTNQKITADQICNAIKNWHGGIPVPAMNVLKDGKVHKFVQPFFFATRPGVKAAKTTISSDGTISLQPAVIVDPAVAKSE